MNKNQVRLLKKLGRVHFCHKNNIGEVSILLERIGGLAESLQVSFESFRFYPDRLEEIDFTQEDAVQYLAFQALQEIADILTGTTVVPHTNTVH